MEESSLRDIQLVQLDMLKDVAAFCREHGLRYYLYCGTLLGCVRHKGFIPWDDDVDIAMPLSDYIKFQKLFPAFDPEKYSLLSLRTDKAHCTNQWVKICRNGTTYATADELRIHAHWGVSMDIYPIVGVYGSKRGEAFQARIKQLTGALLYSDLREAVSVRDSKSIYYAWIQRIPRRVRVFVVRLLMPWLCLDPEKHRRVCTLDAAPICGKFERTIFEETMPGAFEGEQFVIPRRYDEMLRIMYGNYMQLPPESQRKGHTQGGKPRIADIHRDYREYQRDFQRRDKP